MLIDLLVTIGICVLLVVVWRKGEKQGYKHGLNDGFAEGVEEGKAQILKENIDRLAAQHKILEAAQQ